MLRSVRKKCGGGIAGVEPTEELLEHHELDVIASHVILLNSRCVYETGGWTPSC